MYENHKKVGLVIQTSADSLKILNIHNQFETVRILEVSRKVGYKRGMQAVDWDNNAITRFSIIKIIDKSSPLKGQIGEIRALFKEYLFVWIKNQILANSNGFYCVKASQVVNAGAQHLKEANQRAGLEEQENVANLDRQQNNRELMRGQMVMITRGQLKGYKGTVVYAYETSAQIHILCKGEKVTLPREDLFVVHNEMEGVHIQSNANNPVYLSFDEAAN